MQTACDFIGCQKAKPMHIAQKVWFFFKHMNGTPLKLFLNAYTFFGAGTVRPQKGHQLPHTATLLVGAQDPFQFRLVDPANGEQVLRIIVHYVQCAQSKLAHNGLCQLGADPLDHAGG